MIKNLASLRQEYSLLKNEKDRQTPMGKAQLDEIVTLDAKVKELQKTMRATAEAKQAIAKPMPSGLQAQLASLEKQWAALTTAERQGAKGTDIATKWQRATAEAGQYAGTLKQLTAAQEKQKLADERLNIGSVERPKQIHSETAAYEKQSNVISNLRNIAATYLSIYEAGRLIKNIATITGEFELQQKSLAAILQDADRANEIFGQVKRTY